MQRQGKEEYVTNLIAWPHQEASIRSGGKRETGGDGYDRSDRRINTRRTDNYAANNELLEHETCPLGCVAKHPLAACPLYQSSTVNQRWAVVKLNRRCRKCLRAQMPKKITTVPYTMIVRGIKHSTPARKLLP